MGSLPAEVSSFVGRRADTADLKRMLASCRLLTLTGTVGVGKSRLARRVAAQVRRAFHDGVWLVELAGLDDPARLAAAVARGLGLVSTRALGDFVADRQLLLVLDNCDHLVDGCADLADALLRWAPGLRVLCTSRQALGVPGEHVFRVPPLPVPREREPLAGDDWRRYPGLDLFVQRAASARPGFVLVGEDATLAGTVCRRLDGIPLAIELAARRLQAFSLAQLVTRLDDRYTLLTCGGRTAVRHRSMLAAVQGCYERCTPDERLLWSRVSVFGEGFDLAAAEEVAAGGPLARSAVLDVLSGLVDKSILVVEDHGADRRYRLFECLREYGRDKLRSAGEEPLLHRRHRDYQARTVNSRLALADGGAERAALPVAGAPAATPDRARAVAETGPSPLTRRERQVADLVSEGLSNKQIANRLVIAPRTAESHVEHILDKLGLRSRAQIAAWASRHAAGAGYVSAA